MTLETRGREILREVGFDRFRQALVDEIMKKISTEASAGEDLSKIVEEVLREKEFESLFREIVERLVKEADLSEKEGEEAAPLLVEEEVVSEIKESLPGQVDEERCSPTKVLVEGEKKGLWINRNVKRLLGGSSRGVITGFLRSHPIVRLTLAMGFVLLGVSAYLFGSVYRAVIVGLTLTTFPGDSLETKLANVLGGFGGLLIFFISIALFFQYVTETRAREERLREMARRYLEKKEAEGKTGRE